MNNCRFLILRLFKIIKQCPGGRNLDDRRTRKVGILESVQLRGVTATIICGEFGGEEGYCKQNAKSML